jgi:hypothetical protein
MRKRLQNSVAFPFPFSQYFIFLFNIPVVAFPVYRKKSITTGESLFLVHNFILMQASKPGVRCLRGPLFPFAGS